MFSFVCVPFIFGDSTKCRFAVAPCDGFPTFVITIVQVSTVTGLIAEVLFVVFFICNTV